MDTLAIILGGLGLALMAGLSGVASSIGLVIAGSAAVGATKKKPEIFGSALVLSALPASQGLYGFVGFILYSSSYTPQITLFHGAVIFFAGIVLGFVALFSAIKMGQVIAAGITAMGAGANSFAPTLILAAFPEFYAILGFVVAILMQNMLKL